MNLLATEYTPGMSSAYVGRPDLLGIVNSIIASQQPVIVQPVSYETVQDQPILVQQPLVQPLVQPVIVQPQPTTVVYETGDGVNSGGAFLAGAGLGLLAGGIGGYGGYGYRRGYGGYGGYGGYHGGYGGGFHGHGGRR